MESREKLSPSLPPFPGGEKKEMERVSALGVLRWLTMVVRDSLRIPYQAFDGYDDRDTHLTDLSSSSFPHTHTHTHTQQKPKQKSWGGHYIPTLAVRIVREQAKPSASPKLNFVGFLVGNPFTSWVNNRQATVKALVGHSLVSYPTAAAWEEQCADLVVAPQYLLGHCIEIEAKMNMEMADLNPYVRMLERREGGREGGEGCVFVWTRHTASVSFSLLPILHLVGTASTHTPRPPTPTLKIIGALLPRLPGRKPHRQPRQTRASPTHLATAPHHPRRSQSTTEGRAGRRRRSWYHRY